METHYWCGEVRVRGDTIGKRDSGDTIGKRFSGDTIGKRNSGDTIAKYIETLLARKTVRDTIGKRDS